MRGIAQHKLKSRRAIHDRAAVSAFYQDDTLAEPVEITTRWHTKMVKAGGEMEGFDAMIIEGVNRLVFQQPELTSEGRAERGLPALPDDLTELTLARLGTVTIPDYNLVLMLDHEEEPDGPLNIYWSVVKQEG